MPDGTFEKFVGCMLERVHRKCLKKEGTFKRYRDGVWLNFLFVKFKVRQSHYFTAS